MRGFDLAAYEAHFPQDRVEITRWDIVDYNEVYWLFSQEPLKSIAESLLTYFDLPLKEATESDGDFLEECGSRYLYREASRKIARFLYPAGNFDDVLIFLQTVLGRNRAENHEEYFYKFVIPSLSEGIGRNNYYYEPLWVLWRRFLTDVLDVLRQWADYDELKLERIIRCF